ncbi:MAG: hypothetical protein CR988_01295 [Treponema sp.]|nr:MAG: hypothetical protein CR988_01295 [Treponema sp.]
MSKKALILFGSPLCTHCTPAKEYLESKGVKFEYFNITDNLSHLKFFLKFRDNNSDFDELKNRGIIGIPCLMCDNGNRFIFDIENTDLSEFL